MRQQLGAAVGSADIAGQTRTGWQRNGDGWPTGTPTTTTASTTPAKARNNAKLRLAAIVHYDALDQLGVENNNNNDDHHDELAYGNKRHEDVQEGAKQADRLGEPPRRQLVAVGQNSHVERDTARKSSGRLRRLFFTKNKRNKPADDLIDDTRDGQQLELERRPKTTQENTAEASNKNGNNNTKNYNRKIDLESGNPVEQQQHKRASNGDGGEPLNAAERLASSRSPAQVIEFKFDLIVEGDRNWSPASPTAHEGPSLTDGIAENDDDDDEILRPIRQRKLLDHVNELVESFVLDSMDVCLLAAGRRRLGGFACDKLAPVGNQFDYLLKCARLTLTYAFQLLEATGGGGGGGGGDVTGGNRSPPPMGNCSLLRADTRSIELEATLFEQRLADGQLELVDLVGGHDEHQDDLQQAPTGSIECYHIGQALEMLDSIRTRLDERRNGDQNDGDKHLDGCPNRVLMIRFKLRQQVNGGTFTNRMCLLDVSEPSSSSLSQIIESIFSGQALAHLKRQKLQLNALELLLADDKSTPDANIGNSNITLGKQHAPRKDCAGAKMVADNNNKHYHRIASLTRLIQAESLIYKQLNSALIKMLVIVHCHRLESDKSAGCPMERRLEVERHLMEYNLSLLEFANRIRRGSQMRLKRRKRHLRSHLMRSNLSLISDTNLSLASSTDFGLPVTEARLDWPEVCEDLMITSPFRHRLDRSCQSFGHHQRRAHCYAHHHRHHRHRERQSLATSRRHRSTGRNQARHRASSLNRGGSHWSQYASELDLACDSSSPISTPSSGGHSKRPFPIANSSLAYQRTRPPAGLRPAAQEAAIRVAHLAGVSGRSKKSTITESDPDESQASLGSASLMSFHSSGGRLTRTTRNILRNDPRLIRRHFQQQQQSHLMESPSDSNTLDDSIELQSFSSSIGAPNQQLMTPIRQWRDEQELAAAAMAAQQCDTIGETYCSIKVAEPPRQLKLEEFLNRLSNFIGPNASGRPPGEPADDITPTPGANFKRVDQDDEDDDCKSHSSILEHLASLTLESNLKLVKQNQRQATSNERVSIVQASDQQGEKRAGHLQSLLKSTLQLQQRQKGDHKEDLSEQLRALTVDCNLDSAAVADGNQSEKTFLGGGNSFESSETPPTSMDSSGCISSSCSSSTSSNSEASPCQRNSATNSKGRIPPDRVARHHLSSVVRAQIRSP